MKLPNVWDKYYLKIKIRDKLLGGIPRTEDQLKGWLEAKHLTHKEEEIKDQVDLIEEEEKHWCGFRRNGNGLFIRGAMIKQTIKNCASDLRLFNVKGKKGLMGILHRTMFIKPTEISLGKKEPDGQYDHQGTVKDRQGSRSILSRFDYVENVQFECEVWLIETCPMTEEDLKKCLAVGQESGLGPLRPHDYGKFDVLEFKKIEA